MLIRNRRLNQKLQLKPIPEGARFKEILLGHVVRGASIEGNQLTR